MPTKKGQYSATIRVTDQAQNMLSLITELKVRPLGIVTTDLPYAQPAQPYSQQLQAAGGSPPYTWSLMDTSCQHLYQHLVFPNPSGGQQDVFLDKIGFNSIATITPDGVLRVPTPLQNELPVCVTVADSRGKDAKSPVNIVLQPRAIIRCWRVPPATQQMTSP